MKRQLKIIMSYEEEGIDSDGGPITMASVVIYHDDDPIGCIQDINFHASTDQWLPELEITFLDLHDPAFSQQSNLIKDVDLHISALSGIPNVKVNVKKLDTGVKICALDEIGTDGHIDYIPVKRP